jgi:hypothetical protein
MNKPLEKGEEIENRRLGTRGLDYLRARFLVFTSGYLTH